MKKIGAFFHSSGTQNPEDFSSCLELVQARTFFVQIRLRPESRFSVALPKVLRTFEQGDPIEIKERLSQRLFSTQPGLLARISLRFIFSFNRSLRKES
ncbi:hypothetical protein FG381_12205 [Sutterella faecalis]|uniref:Uncharacterized protein n=2 Tax=Sutterella TaxID=40544 RepID=A0AAI9SBK8_9BURK|nr:MULTISPECIES: hypothetical protein [Sutterella]KAB7651154.1 hypothetical protein GBM96_06795 [Sutterella seckii]QDA55633.1 hypothetical protein FG381_12205 [Sutterella faecalis]